MTGNRIENVSNHVSADDEAFLRSNSLNDIRHLVSELSDLGEDTKDISVLISELEELYESFEMAPAGTAE